MIKWCEVFGVKENEEFEIKYKLGCGKKLICKIVNNDVYVKDPGGDFSMNRMIMINYIECVEKVKRFTAQERLILKSIDKKYNYIARKKTNDLYLYKFEPKKYIETGTWISEDFYITEFEAFNHLFNDIKWEDYEAVCIDDVVERK